MVGGVGYLLRDDLFCVALVTVPSFLLDIGIVAVLGLSMRHPEAGVGAGLLACAAELLPAVF